VKYGGGLFTMTLRGFLHKDERLTLHCCAVKSLAHKYIPPESIVSVLLHFLKPKVVGYSIGLYSSDGG